MNTPNLSSSAELAISAVNLSKIFRLYSNPLDRLKESLSPLGKKFHNDFYALNNVSFDVKKGETIGIVGRNGSGKSTLLKLIAGVLTPSSGSIIVDGKVAALLELGAGFNPELTGIENIYFNGTLLGFSREEIDEKLDDIISFADIGEFINQPLKAYSSGMFVRLAFAVNINVDADVLIVDEALSVGDIKFQRKCYSRIEQLRNANKTVLFVSHGLDTINLFCDKAILLDNGKLHMSGLPKEITKVFYKLMLGYDQQEYPADESQSVATVANGMDLSQDHILANRYNGPEAVNNHVKGIIKTKISSKQRHKKAEIVDCGIFDSNNNKVTLLESGKQYVFYSVVLVNENLDIIHLGYKIRNSMGVMLFAVNSEVQQKGFIDAKRDDIIEGRVDLTMWLAPGQYFLTFRAATRYEDYDELLDKILFTVVGDCQIVNGSLVNLEPKVSVKSINSF